MTNKQNIINRLLSVEARAKATAQECYEIRRLLHEEESVSTPSKEQRGLTEEQLNAISAKRIGKMFKNKQ